MEHWTTGECLALVHAVLKFGENSWEDVSKAICKYSKELHRPIDVVEENSIPRDDIFFSPKRCAEKFTEIIAAHTMNRDHNAEQKEKPDDSSSVVAIANKLREARMEELRKSIESRESNMKKLKEEMAEISSGAWDALLEAENKDTENDNATETTDTPVTAKEPSKPEIQPETTTSVEELPSKKQKLEKSAEEGPVTKTEVVVPSHVTEPIIPVRSPPVQAPPAMPISPILPPPQPREVQPTPMEVMPTTTIIAEPEPKPEVAPTSPVYLPVEVPMAESPPSTAHAEKDKEEDESNSKKKRKASKLKTKKTPKEKSEHSATATPTPSSPVATTPSSIPPPSPTFTAIKLESSEPSNADMSPIAEIKKEKASKHSGKGDTVRTLLDTLKKISAHKYAHVFKQPVSLEEAPDYDEIIKQRMDLSTIKKNLIDGKIATTHEFWRDLLLMFQNAMIYNMKGSEIYNMAAKLKKFSAKEMEPIFAAEEKMRMALQQNQAPGKRTLRSSSSGIPSQKY